MNEQIVGLGLITGSVGIYRAVPSHRMLQIQVHMESSQLMSRQSGTEACLSSSTMMLASRPSDCQCVDFSGPSSYLSMKNRGWLVATVWNIWTSSSMLAKVLCQKGFQHSDLRTTT